MVDFSAIQLTADSLLSLPKLFYPWFDVCHILLCVLTVRKECGRKVSERETPPTHSLTKKAILHSGS